MQIAYVSDTLRNKFSPLDFTSYQTETVQCQFWPDVPLLLMLQMQFFIGILDPPSLSVALFIHVYTHRPSPKYARRIRMHTFQLRYAAAEYPNLLTAHAPTLIFLCCNIHAYTSGFSELLAWLMAY